MVSDLLVWPHLRNPALTGALLFKKDTHKLKEDKRSTQDKTLHYVRDSWVRKAQGGAEKLSSTNLRAVGFSGPKNITE